jgi:hypothetical protein
MNDEIYRPQKAQVRPQDNDLQKTSQMQQQIKEDMENYHPQQTNQPVNQRTNSEVNPAMNPAITGPVPEQYKKYFGSISEELVQTPKINVKAQGSDKFEQLMNGLKTQLYEEINLPSKGKFYDGLDGPTNGILSVRRMTGKEEEILATQRLVKKNLALDMIFDKCIKENYKSENLLVADRVYLLIYLRGISISENYDVEVTCPKCDKTFETSINLGELSVDYCPDDFNSASLRGILPQSGYSFSYRLPTAVQDKEVQKRLDFVGGFAKDANAPDDLVHYRTALAVTDIEGLTDKEELKLLIENLSIGDSNYLRNVINNPPFGVNTKTMLDCNFCKSDFLMELPFGISFFFPKGQKKTTQV